MVTRFPRTSIANEVVSLRDAMDRLFNESFVPDHFRTPWSTASDGGRAVLPLDVYATGDEIVVLAAVPGINPEEIEVTIEKNTVVLSGQIPNVANAEETNGATWYLHELPSGTFRRSLTLPIEVDAARAEATFEHGMLRLSLPKADAAKPKQIKVKISSGTDRSSAAIPEQTEQTEQTEA